MADFENVKKLLDKSRELGIPAMDIVIYHRGREVFREIRGVMNEEGKPLSDKTLFNLYSTSKVITCIAALTLVDDGILSLDDEISDYLPVFGDMKVLRGGEQVKAEKPIKLYHLFTMTGGLCYDAYSPEIALGKEETGGKCPTVKMMDYIAKMPLLFEPGESWRYSFSHDVLAAIVEVASGKRFGEYLRQRIFDPLGMTDATYSLDESRLPEVCTQYLYDKEKGFQNIGKNIRSYKLGSEYESGGAGGVSTVNDYIKFLEGVRLGRVISPETIELMTRDYLTPAQREACWVEKGYSYGLGVRVPDKSGIRTDFGWNGAAGAYAAIDLKNEITLYYSQAVLASPARPLQSSYIEAAKLDLGLDACVSEMWKERLDPKTGIY